MGKNVNSIEEAAFEDCPRLASVTLPESVNGIGGYAFRDCTGLKTISIGNNVRSIGDYAFDGCIALTNTTLPNGLASIGECAFRGCTRLTSISLPNALTYIGLMAFHSCSGLTNATIGISVTSIGDYAFSECSGLTSITLPNMLNRVGFMTFRGCTGLTNITVASLNPFYCDMDGVLFSKNQDALIQYPSGKAGGYDIPACVTNIGNGAFANCAYLTSVTVPASVITIGDYAFSGCTSLVSAYFRGNAPKYVSAYAFESSKATINYIFGTAGWDLALGGQTTQVWETQVLPGGISFGAKDNLFGFNFTGAGENFIIEACKDLANPIWSPVGTNTLKGGTSHFNEVMRTDIPCRFYRLRSQ